MNDTMHHFAEKMIGSRKFRTSPVPASVAFELQFRLGNVLSHGTDRMGEIAEGFGKDVSAEAKKRSDAAMMAAMLHVLTGSARENVTLIADLCKCGQMQAPSGMWDAVDLDAAFTGRLQDVPDYLAWIVTEQFGPFIRAVAARIGSLMPAQETAP